MQASKTAVKLSRLRQMKIIFVTISAKLNNLFKADSRKQVGY